MMRKGPMTFIDDHAFDRWDYHLSKTYYPSSELRILLTLFVEKDLQRLVTLAEQRGTFFIS